MEAENDLLAAMKNPANTTDYMFKQIRLGRAKLGCMLEDLTILSPPKEYEIQICHQITLITKEIDTLIEMLRKR